MKIKAKITVTILLGVTSLVLLLNYREGRQSPLAIKETEVTEKIEATRVQINQTNRDKKVEDVVASPITQKSQSNQLNGKPLASDPRVTYLPDGRNLFNPAVEASQKLQSSLPIEIHASLVGQIFGHYRYAFKYNP